MPNRFVHPDSAHGGYALIRPSILRIRTENTPLYLLNPWLQVVPRRSFVSIPDLHQQGFGQMLADELYAQG